jgi:hypothetical protein
MPPDTSAYMYAAYAVAGAVYALYALSLWRRRREVRARLRALDQADGR